jgi:hypothetical protein
LFISQLIDGRFYYIAEKPPSTKAPSRLLRWSIVPHKPEPIIRVHFSEVPLYIREHCERLFNGDSRRQYTEEKNNEIILRSRVDAGHDHGSVGAKSNDVPQRQRPAHRDGHDGQQRDAEHSVTARAG